MPQNFKKKQYNFICIVGEVHFDVLEKGICHLSAASSEKGSKMSVFWSGKIRIW